MTDEVWWVENEKLGIAVYGDSGTLSSPTEAVTLTVKAVVGPKKYTTSTLSETVDLPGYLHQVIVYYCLMNLADSEGNAEKAMYYTNKWQMGLREAKKYRSKHYHGGTTFYRTRV